MKLGINILEGLRFSSCAFHYIFAYISKVMAAYTFPYKKLILHSVSLIRGSRDYDVIIKLSLKHFTYFTHHYIQIMKSMQYLRVLYF